MDNFNEACRGIVLRYTTEWERIVRRMGRWVDFENGYRTMDLNYMESIWYIFKRLWDMGLIYDIAINKNNSLKDYMTKVNNLILIHHYINE